jgi:hypothetical protein
MVRESEGRCWRISARAIGAYKGEASLAAIASVLSSSHTSKHQRSIKQSSSTSKNHHTHTHTHTHTTQTNRLQTTCSSSVPPASARTSLRLPPRLLAPRPLPSASTPLLRSNRRESRQRSSQSPRTIGPTQPCGQSELPSDLKCPASQHITLPSSLCDQ